jgi:hypothetical protein
MLGKSEFAVRLGSRRGAIAAVAAGLLAAGVLLLWWVGPGSEDQAQTTVPAPAMLEPVEGSELLRVRLTPRAAERLDVQTQVVRAAPATEPGSEQTVIPYSALLYDPGGETWVYTNRDPLVFLRARVRVERIEGRFAFLSEGPPPGTSVVSVGAAELYGAELGVDH